MQTLSFTEVNQVSGGGFISLLGEGVMMASTGFVCAATAAKFLADATLPYVGTLPVEAYAIAGFVAGATAIYGLTHNTLSSHNTYS